MSATHRIGNVTIHARPSPIGVKIYVRTDPPFSEIAATLTTASDMEIAVVPVALWEAIEKLLEMRTDVDQLVALLMNNNGWREGNVEDQLSAFSSKLSEVTRAALVLQRKAK